MISALSSIKRLCFKATKNNCWGWGYTNEKKFFCTFPLATKTDARATWFYFCYNLIQYASLNPTENTYSQLHTLRYAFDVHIVFNRICKKKEIIKTKDTKSILLLHFLQIYTYIICEYLLMCFHIVTLSLNRKMLYLCCA